MKRIKKKRKKRREKRRKKRLKGEENEALIRRRRETENVSVKKETYGANYFQSPFIPAD